MGLWRVGGVLVFMIWSFVLFPRGWAGRQRRALTIGESPEIDDDVVSVFSISSMSLFSDKFFFSSCDLSVYNCYFLCVILMMEAGFNCI